MPFRGLWGALQDGNGRISSGHLLLLLLGLLLVSFPGVFLGLDSFFYRDFGLFGAPLASFHRQVFWEGELPLWNPLNNCGIPFAAQWNTMVFYPFSLIYLLLPFPWSLNLFCLGHAAWGGVTMYWLARWWIGRTGSLGPMIAGLAFAWNGLTLHALMWPNNIAALAWMPWVVLSVQLAARRGGRQVFGAVFAGAVQMLAGAPEIIGFTWGISLLLLFSGRHGPDPRTAGPATPEAFSGWRYAPMAGRFCAVFALVLAVSAIQLLPFLDLLSLSQRNRHFGGDSWSLPAWGLANFFVPLFRSTPSRLGVYSQDEQQWTSSYYMGIGVMLLALIALFNQRDRGTRLLGCVLLMAIWLAFGQTGWLYQWVNQVLPVLGFVRFPVKFIVLAVFTLALLAGQGGDWVLRQPLEQVQRVCCRTGLVLAGLCGVILAVAFLYPFPGDSWPAAWKSGMSRIAFLVLMGAGIIFRVRGGEGSARFLSACGILLCLGLDVLTHAPAQNPVVPASSFACAQAGRPAGTGDFQRTLLTPGFKGFMSYASTDSALENWKGLRAAHYANCNLLDGTPKTDGFYSLYLRDEALLRERMERTPNLTALPILDFLSVDRVPDPKVIFGWEQRKGFLPLVTSGQRPVFVSEGEALERAGSMGFKPAEEVCLPITARAADGNESAAGAEIDSRRMMREKILFTTRAEKPAWVVVGQAYHPAWRLSVDSKPGKIFKANGAFQAFQVPAGTHQVEISYRDNKLFLGAIISVLAMGLCAGGFLLSSRFPGWSRQP